MHFVSRENVRHIHTAEYVMALVKAVLVVVLINSSNIVCSSMHILTIRTRPVDKRINS